MIFIVITPEAIRTTPSLTVIAWSGDSWNGEFNASANSCLCCKSQAVRYRKEARIEGCAMFFVLPSRMASRSDGTGLLRGHGASVCVRLLLLAPASTGGNGQGRTPFVGCSIGAFTSMPDRQTKAELSCGSKPARCSLGTLSSPYRRETECARPRRCCCAGTRWIGIEHFLVAGA